MLKWQSTCPACANALALMLSPGKRGEMREAGFFDFSGIVLGILVALVWFYLLVPAG